MVDHKKLKWILHSAPNRGSIFGPLLFEIDIFDMFFVELSSEIADLANIVIN